MNSNPSRTEAGTTRVRLRSFPGAMRLSLAIPVLAWIGLSACPTAPDTAPGGHPAATSDDAAPSPASGVPAEAEPRPVPVATSSAQAVPKADETDPVRQTGLRLFLPFRGSRDSYDFSRVSAYRIHLPLGHTGENGHESFIPLIVRKDGPEPWNIPQSTVALSATRNPLRGGITVALDGIPCKDRSIVVSGFPEGFDSPKTMRPGAEVFRIVQELPFAPDTMVTLDLSTGRVASQKMKRDRILERPVPKPASVVPPPQPLPPLPVLPPAMVRTDSGESFRNISPEKGTLTFVSSFKGFLDVPSVVTWGDQLFMSTGPGGTVESFDVANPRYVTHEASERLFKIGEQGTGRIGMHRWRRSAGPMDLQGDRLVVLDSGYDTSQTLIVYGLRKGGGVDRLGAARIEGVATALTTAGNTAWIATTERLVSVDLSHPAQPQIRGSLALGGLLCRECYLLDLHLAGGRLFAAAMQTGTLVFSASDPIQFTHLLTLKGKGAASAVESLEKRLYVAEFDPTSRTGGAIVVYDDLTSRNPRRTAEESLPTGEGPFTLKRVGTELFAGIIPIPVDTSESRGVTSLRVFEIGAPGRPKPAGAYTPKSQGCRTRAIATKPPYVFLATFAKTPDEGCGLVTLLAD